uniref:Uncharacterized protein n=1 Tax=viral metagenome TaxID=1070528 RepID=A0A6M3J3T0_9ZZZZ
MVKAGSSYDVAIKYKNKIHGLMLHSASDGTLLYEDRDEEAIPPSYITSTPTHRNLPPQRRWEVEQEYFHGGFGEATFGENYKYFKSTNVDARIKGKTVLGPANTSITLSATPTPIMTQLNDPSFESWSSSTALTYWTLESGTITREDGTNLAPYHNRYAVARASNGILYQDVTWSDTFQSQEFTAVVYAYAVGGGNDIRINIDDGVGTTSSAWYGTGAWAQLSVTRTLNAAATRLRVEIEFAAVCYFDMVGVFPTGGQSRGSVNAFCDFRGLTYVAMGSTLYTWNGTTLTYVDAYAYPITTLCVYGNYMYIGQMGGKYNYMDYAGTVTTSNLTGGEADYFAMIGATFYGVQLPNKVRSSTNPINGGSWSAQSYVGNATVPITGILNHTDTIYIPKENGMWTIDGASIYNKIDILEQDAVTDGCKKTIKFQDKLYIPTGVCSLWEFDDSTDIATNISPTNYIKGDSEYIQDILALSADSEYLYVFQDYTNSVNLFAGHYETILGNTYWLWHPIAQITSADITAVHLATYSGVKQLLYGTGTPTMGYFDAATQFGDLDADTNYTFAASGTLETGYFTASFPNYYKNFYSLEVLNSNTSGTQTITVHYQLYGATDWRLLGVVDTTPSVVLYFPQETYSKKLKLRFSFATADTSTSPVLEDYILKGQVRIGKLKEFKFTARITEYLTTLASPTSIKKEDLVDILHTIDRDSWVVRFYDIDNDPYWITIQKLAQGGFVRNAKSGLDRLIQIEALQADWKAKGE